MLVWENKTQSNSNSFKQICDEVERVGKPSRHFMPGYERIKNVWTQSFKAWEYPFIYLWLEKLSKQLHLNRKLKVMDFGCGRSVFPEFLAIKGFDVWGIDNDREHFISPIRKEMEIHYPHVTYWIGEILDFNLTKFDAIVSSSVLEHILPVDHRLKIVKKLKVLLESHGKTLHIIDFYFPEMKAKKDNRIDFYKMCKESDFTIGDMSMCPNSPEFNFNEARRKVDFILPEYGNRQARIAIGDFYD